MNLLLVNIGNSQVVVARAGDSAADPDVVWRGDTTPAAAAAVAALAGPDVAVAVASVVPAVAVAVQAAVPAAQVVDHTWRFPFAHELRHPDTVGADRWCNAAAAVVGGRRDALVVDAGTATTLDVVRDGVFLGGLIAPGMAFAARALQERAARLWPVPFAPCDLRAGRDTEEALAVGAFHVGVHGVTGTIEALLTRYPGLAVVLTGGLAGFVTRPGWYHDPLWTLRGLAVLAATR